MSHVRVTLESAARGKLLTLPVQKRVPPRPAPTSIPSGGVLLEPTESSRWLLAIALVVSHLAAFLIGAVVASGGRWP